MDMGMDMGMGILPFEQRLQIEQHFQLYQLPHVLARLIIFKS